MDGADWPAAPSRFGSPTRNLGTPLRRQYLCPSRTAYLSCFPLIVIVHGRPSMLSMSKICLTRPSVKHIVGPMLSIHKQGRPTRLQADEAPFVCERGSSRGQGRGDYTPETPSSNWLPAS